MSLATLKENQARLKQHYQAEPDRARVTLTARGQVDFERLAVVLEQPGFLSPAGLHPAGGGDGSCACPVEIFLAGLASCAGVTLAAVATSMRLPLTAATVTVEGDLDFRGTLAVDRGAPVALTAIRLVFDIVGGAAPEQLDKLKELAHRYCVVHRTLDQPPPVEVLLRQV